MGWNYYNDAVTGKSYPSGSAAYSAGDGLVTNRTGTLAEKNALTDVTTGTQFYDTSDSKLYVYNGTAWVAQT